MLDLTKLKNKLPHGAQTQIAKNANVHLNVVHRVLNGKSENLIVLKAIAEFLKSHDKIRTETLKTISTLID